MSNSGSSTCPTRFDIRMAVLSGLDVSRLD